MKSFRFDSETERWLEDTARANGQTVSDVVREAVRKHAVRKPRPKTIAEGLGSLMGSFSSGSRSNASAHTGREFTRLLLAGKRKRRTR